jgi:hypothetical protein
MAHAIIQATWEAQVEVPRSEVAWEKEKVSRAHLKIAKGKTSKRSQTVSWTLIRRKFP